MIWRNGFRGYGVDGFLFILAFAGGLDDFLALVIPELQSRGLFRPSTKHNVAREYGPRTAKESLPLTLIGSGALCAPSDAPAASCYPHRRQNGTRHAQSH